MRNACILEEDFKKSCKKLSRYFKECILYDENGKQIQPKLIKKPVTNQKKKP